MPLVLAVIPSICGEPDCAFTSKSTAVRGMSCWGADLCCNMSLSGFLGFWGQADWRIPFDSTRDRSGSPALRSVDSEFDHRCLARNMNDAYFPVPV